MIFRKAVKFSLAALTLFVLSVGVFADLTKEERREIEAKFPDSNDPAKPKTFLVVRNAGIPANPDKPGPFGGIKVRDFPKTEIAVGVARITESYAVLLQPGTVVTLLVRRVRDDNVEFWVRTVTPYQVERGLGSYRHSTHEAVNAQVKFMLKSGDGLEETIRQIEEWFAPYQSLEEAARFGNTASGAFVKEIRLGMTIAEVEAVFGPPKTKIDLGERILYKYEDMTVEFTKGTVSDVR